MGLGPKLWAMVWKAPSILLLLALALGACGRAEAPPGRWEGFGESANWLIAVRLEVHSDNEIKASALSAGVEGATLPQRMALEQELKASMLKQWSEAPKAQVSFKGNAIVRKDGYAPLFVFDPAQGTMTFHFYAGGKLSERVTLKPVTEFKPR